jgi:hypothetical protein
MSIGTNVSNLQRTMMTQRSGKHKKFLGFFWTILKTLEPRTPVKLLRVCTNTHDTLPWNLPNLWRGWHQEPQWSCYVCVPIHTKHYLGLSPTLEEAGTKNPSEAATCVYQYTRHIILDSPQTLKTKALHSFKTLGNAIPATQRHIS